jgi:hypothetical protein
MVEIHNVLGEAVFSQYSLLNTPYSIDVSPLAKGVYMVELNTAEKVYRAKFIKE